MIASCTVTVEGSNLEKIVGQMQTSNKTVTDDNGNTVVVPGGFKVVPNDEKVSYTYSGDGAPNVQDGVVIQDNKGNQFVWIPVGNIKNKDGTTTKIILGRYEFDSSDGTPTLRQNATNYSNEVTILSNFQELTSDAENKAAKDLGGFINSTNSNGGYYLGRYEASGGLNSIMVKAGENTYIGMSQHDAAYSARTMYQGNNYVESDLINSYSWDTAIVFIQNYSGNGNYANELCQRPSPGGKTGNTNDIVCNIHEMAGKSQEWSTEHSSITVTELYTFGPGVLRRSKRGGV